MKIYTEEQLPQGSKEWLEVRRQYGTASEAAAAMSVNPWVPKTPLQLWELKNGERVITSNFAMENGNKYEEEAKNAYQHHSGKLYEPCCITSIIDELPLMASLDGRQVGGTSILEIKVPLNGSCSPLWDEMENNGDLPIQYQMQMQQQMMVSEEKVCEFWVYDWKHKKGLHREIKQDLTIQAEIKEAWRSYFKGKPEPGSKDVVKKTDPEWIACAKKWDAANAAVKKSQIEVKEYRAALIELCEGKSYEGAKVRCRKNNETGAWTVRNVKC